MRRGDILGGSRVIEVKERETTFDFLVASKKRQWDRHSDGVVEWMAVRWELGSKGQG